MTVEQYTRQLVALLPRGSIWAAELGSRMRQVLEAFSEGFARAHLRFLVMIDEADPRSTSELLADWERVAGLPGPCTTELGETLQQRREALVQRLTSTGGSTPADLVAVAAQLGFPNVEIIEFDPFHVGDPVGLPLYGDAWQFAFEVASPDEVAVTEFRTGQSVTGEPLRAWGNETLECAIDHFKPAHTVAIFTFGS